MVTKKEYIKAKEIVAKYEEQRAKAKKETKSIKLKKGDSVTTKKGCRMSTVKLTGKVTGFCTWGEYEAVKVKKDGDGRTVICLKKNLVKL